MQHHQTNRGQGATEYMLIALLLALPMVGLTLGKEKEKSILQSLLQNIDKRQSDNLNHLGAAMIDLEPRERKNEIQQEK